jgi:hypothetical protein
MLQSDWQQDYQQDISSYFSPCSVSFVLIGEYIQYSPLINFRLIIPSNIHLVVFCSLYFDIKATRTSILQFTLSRALSEEQQRGVIQRHIRFTSLTVHNVLNTPAMSLQHKK